MQTLAAGISYLDLNFGGRQRIIASAALHGRDGVAIVDPGPSSTLPALRAALAQSGIALADVTALLLTHIHLDHAGAAGTLVSEYPKLRVYVHERGAPHLENPEKLVASATRLYGEAMDRLWGPVRPVPKSAIAVLTGHERVIAGGRPYEVVYTPGHASHHVSYFNADSGIAFVGDTAGVKLQADGYALPPTPPPDIDLEAWRDSLARIAAWRADTLLLTHFGPVTTPDAHLGEFREHLERISNLVRTSLDQPGGLEPGDDSPREAWFKEQVMRELRTKVTEEEARNYEAAGRFDLNWRGLARYWRKRLPSTR